MDPIKTGKIISEARKEMGLTQKQLAECMGVSEKAVSKWECGRSFPDITVVIPLSETLNLSLYDLLEGEHMDTDDTKDILKSTIEHYSDEAKRKKRNVLLDFLILLGAISAIGAVLMLFGHLFYVLITRAGAHDIIYNLYILIEVLGVMIAAILFFYNNDVEDTKFSKSCNTIKKIFIFEAIVEIFGSTFLGQYDGSFFEVFNISVTPVLLLFVFIAAVFSVIKNIKK